LEKKKCQHGYEVDPITNEHIFPKGNTYTIKEHDDGKTYTVIDHQPEQPKLDTDKLLAEARSLIEYNKREKEKQQEQPRQEVKPKKPINEIRRFISILKSEE
jgi:hypothetical protein